MKQESPTILEEEPEFNPNLNVNEENNDKSGQQKGSEALKSEPIPITISVCKDRKSRLYFRTFTTHYWSLSLNFLTLGSMKWAPREPFSHYWDHSLGRERKMFQNYCFRISIIKFMKCLYFYSIILFVRFDWK